MTAQIADIPEGVRLALEKRDDDGATRGEGEQGAFKELDEELLIVAHLSIDVGGFAADVGEVEYLAVRRSAAQNL